MRLVTKGNTNFWPIEAATRKVPQEKVLQKFCKIHSITIVLEFFNKVTGVRLATFLKKRLQHTSSPVNFAKCLRTRFLQNTCGQLLVVLRSKFDLLSNSYSFFCTVLELESKKMFVLSL